MFSILKSNKSSQISQIKRTSKSARMSTKNLTPFGRRLICENRFTYWGWRALRSLSSERSKAAGSLSCSTTTHGNTGQQVDVIEIQHKGRAVLNDFIWRWRWWVWWFVSSFWMKIWRSGVLRRMWISVTIHPISAYSEVIRKVNGPHCPVPA